MRIRTIIDCYTDEPAGLGVSPFLGVWPRYIAGNYKDIPNYLTIDDLRLAAYKKRLKPKDLDPLTGKTRIDLINHTRPQDEIQKILKHTDQFIIIAGIHTPGKYLRAIPGSIKEITNLLKPYKTRKIFIGPASILGSQQLGGKFIELPNQKDFDEIREFTFANYSELQDYALKGANILKQIPDNRIIEIETGRGCTREIGCSFCSEPLKHKPESRDSLNIIEEIKKFQELGATAFRLGKQSCIFSYKNGDLRELEQLLKGIHALNPEIFHIDNVNPNMVTEARLKLFTKYLTPGNTAAMGIESFDLNVIKLNNLNTTPATALKAIRLINELGAIRGENGTHILLPGINIILGLAGETKETLDINFRYLKQILDEGLLVRRINIRQVVPIPGTKFEKETGFFYLNKNKKYYKPWIQKVRQEIDLPMLKRLFPKGTILKDLYTETHEGNVTFLRHLGSYPIIVGIKERLLLAKRYNIQVTDHMPRSLTGELLDIR